MLQSLSKHLGKYKPTHIAITEERGSIQIKDTESHDNRRDRVPSPRGRRIDSPEISERHTSGVPDALACWNHQTRPNGRDALTG